MLDEILDALTGALDRFRPLALPDFDNITRKIKGSDDRVSHGVRRQARLECNYSDSNKAEGHFTHWRKRTRFFQNKRIYTDF